MEWNKLVEQFRRTKESPTFLPTPVSEYVMTHIYQPLRHGETVRFSQLDFSQFSGEDIETLEENLERQEKMSNFLTEINRKFVEASPASVRTRAFC